MNFNIMGKFCFAKRETHHFKFYFLACFACTHRALAEVGLTSTPQNSSVPWRCCTFLVVPLHSPVRWPCLKLVYLLDAMHFWKYDTKCKNGNFFKTSERAIKMELVLKLYQGLQSTKGFII